MKLAPQQPEPGAHSVKANRPWYGNQILISDAVTVSVMAVGIGIWGASESSRAPGMELSAVGALGYLLAPSIIHVAHHRPAISLASTSVRLALPMLAMTGVAYQCPPLGNQGDKCENGSWQALGFAAGILSASLIDIGLFSYDAPTTESNQTVQFSVAPYVSQDGKRGELRVLGTF
ncbi:MAG TPA: hypothetical protein VER04_19045 [Polyangiaceae bacterium]|nr:hypothetical protein [Polyangiaceae bacterium]